MSVSCRTLVRITYLQWLYSCCAINTFVFCCIQEYILMVEEGTPDQMDSEISEASAVMVPPRALTPMPTLARHIFTLYFYLGLS